MSLQNYQDGEILTGSYLRAGFAESFNSIAQNVIRQLKNNSVVFSLTENDIIADAFSDSDGRLNSVDTDTTTAQFDTDKYRYPTGGNDSFVVIEATSISAVSDFAINDCKIKNIATGKWLLWCTAGTAEVCRAQIYKTLFFGTDGTNPRASSTYITSITALKTSISRDVGKRAYYGSLYSTMNASLDYTVTFSDTSNNTDCSGWAKCYTQSTGYGDTSRFFFPLATLVNTRLDEIGTDTSADENDNLTSCKLNISGSSYSVLNKTQAIIICKGSTTWVQSSTDPAVTYDKTDFYTDNSIPLFTATSETFDIFVSIDLSTSVFPSINDTINKAICATMIEDWETGADIQYKLLNSSENSGWLDMADFTEITSFTAFTSKPTELQIKLIAKTSSPTANTPSINGFCLRVS